MSKNEKNTPHTIIEPEEWDKLDSHDLRFLHSQAKGDPEKLYNSLKKENLIFDMEGFLSDKKED